MAVLFGGIASWTLQQHGVEAALSWWLFYLATVLMILSAVCQTHLLNRAMQSLGDTTSIVPVFEVSVSAAGIRWLLCGNGWFLQGVLDFVWCDWRFSFL